jgi:hypothetical protein
MKYAEQAKDATIDQAKVIATTATGNAVYAGAGAGITSVISLVFLAIGLYFVWRSFYEMRIPKREEA